MPIEERERILETLAGRHDLKGRRNYALALFLFYSGLRESEVVNLRVDDVHLDTEHPYLRVRDGKGQKDRTVPIVPLSLKCLASCIHARLSVTRTFAPESASDGLRVYLARVRPAFNAPADKPWLFLQCHRNRLALEPLHPKALWKMAKEVISPIINRRVGVHTFRHSYATHIYEASADLNLIKSLLGHSSITTTAIYAHVTPPKQREKLAESLK